MYTYIYIYIYVYICIMLIMPARPPGEQDGVLRQPQPRQLQAAGSAILVVLI